MDRSDEIAGLLGEIRDLHRAHLEEYRQVSRELMDLNRAATEKALAQYRAAVRSGNGVWWALVTMISILGAINFLVLLYVAEIASSLG